MSECNHIKLSREEEEEIRWQKEKNKPYYLEKLRILNDDLDEVNEFLLEVEIPLPNLILSSIKRLQDELRGEIEYCKRKVQDSQIEIDQAMHNIDRQVAMALEEDCLCSY